MEESKQPRSRRKKWLLIAGVALAIYIISFAAFVIRGRVDETKLDGWFFTYQGVPYTMKGAPKSERVLFVAYLPLLEASRLVGIRIAYFSPLSLQ